LKSRALRHARRCCARGTTDDVIGILERALRDRSAAPGDAVIEPDSACDRHDRERRRAIALNLLELTCTVVAGVRGGRVRVRESLQRRAPVRPTARALQRHLGAAVHAEQRSGRDGLLAHQDGQAGEPALHRPSSCAVCVGRYRERRSAGAHRRRGGKDAVHFIGQRRAAAQAALYLATAPRTRGVRPTARRHGRTNRWRTRCPAPNAPTK
jgi:hypothetical protein